MSVRNRGISRFEGNIGVGPKGSADGIAAQMLDGQVQTGDAVLQAATDLSTAFRQADDPACTEQLESGALGGRAFAPGVYCIASGAVLSGIVTLDGKGEADSLFIFRIEGDFRTGSRAQVNLVNGTQPCNVYWKVMGRARIGKANEFSGSLLAMRDVQVHSGSDIEGRILSQYGSVRIEESAVTYCARTDVAQPPKLIEGAAQLMSGAGTLETEDGPVNYGFALHCVAGQGAENLELESKAGRFQLTRLRDTSCRDDPAIEPAAPPTGFDTISGEGAGRWKGRRGFHARWTFTDRGLTGLNDFAEIVIMDPAGRQVFAASGDVGSERHQSR